MSGNLLPSRSSQQSATDCRTPPIDALSDDTLSGDASGGDASGGGAVLRQRLETEARRLEFDAFAIAPALPADGFPHLMQWIESGYAAGMDYFQKRAEAYRHPDGVLTGARSIIVLTKRYASSDHVPPLSSTEGRIARYVWGHEDYHDVIHPKLKQLCRVITDASPDAAARGVVDTAPLMEREIAQLAGLGWRGKNTLLLNKFVGSYFFLACVLTNLELPIDSPHVADHCGTCTACLDACPTDAFPQPGVLDANRCISYLTIENRGPIPLELRDPLGDWLFGCDVCQQVCPWNQRQASRSRRRTNAIPETNTLPDSVEADSDESATKTTGTEEAALDRLSLCELFDLTDEQFRARFRKTPLWRARRRGILRNAAIVLGNSRNPAALEALQKGLLHEDEIVQEACQ
ncbi:MAG: tRNA epoxyqueuosine(34) reductase QueG, partial [Planctomycetota bacterium]